MSETASKPSVLFVCVKNGGKSHMAAGLMRKIPGDAVQVASAGTQPGTNINDLSAQVLAEVGVDISDQTPKPIDPQLLRDVDIVVTLGHDAHVEPVAGTLFENWDTDEPSERGIDGIETHATGPRRHRRPRCRASGRDDIKPALTASCGPVTSPGISNRAFWTE
jgi:arsenate-mycothiol transferase